MLCYTCRRALLRRINASTRNSPCNIIRTVATVPATPNAAPATPPPSSSSPKQTSPPAATSSATPGKSQPFSEPNFPSPADASITPSVQKPSVFAPKRLTSSVAGGTELRGLNYTRGAPPLLAKEDNEYPSWLWTLLDASKSTADPTALDSRVDVASMSKKTRAKHERKQAKLLAGMEKPVPIHEQSRDLTGPEDSAITSLEQRNEITKSSRIARRKEIREANFLRSM